MNIKNQLLRMNRRSVGVAFALIMLVVMLQNLLTVWSLLWGDLYGKARIIANQCASALERRDAEGAQAALAALKDIRNVSRAWIVGPAGETLARFPAGGIPLPLPVRNPLKASLSPDWTSLTLVEPVRQDGGTLGAIILQANTRPYLAWLGLNGIILATIGVVGIFVASILFSRFQRTISGPISHLVETMQVVSRDKDYSHRVPVSGQEELAILARRFNEMLETTQSWHHEILAHRQNLERMVVDRTQQWQEANQSLASELDVRRQTEEELRRKSHELGKVSEDLQRALTAEKRFLATMSHEMRTPLNAVIGFLEVLLTTTLDEHQRKLVAAVRSSSQHLLALICDVLDVSKIDSGQMQLFLEPIDLGKVLQECATLIGSRIKPGVRFRYEVPSFPFSVRGDALRLKQVFLNLLGNAAKFTDRGEIALSLIAQTDLPDHRVALAIRVTDTGIGIPEEEIPNLFQPFRQLNSSKYEGTGLGLYISAALVRMMGGSIDLQSREGVGTTITASLVLEKGPPLQVDRPPANLPADLADLTRLRILIVEDLELNVLVLKELLATFFHIPAPTVAENGEQALELLGKEAFDLVFMDVQMPVMDGITATREIRRRGLQVPIIAMSAHAFLDEIDQARQAGMTDYLTKPAQKEKLASLFRTLFPAPAPALVATEAAGMEAAPPSLKDRIFRQFLGTFGNRQTAERLLRLSVESIQACAGALEEGRRAGDPKALEGTLHKLHGALLNCGIGDLAETTAQLHRLAKARQLDELEAKIPTLLAHLADLAGNVANLSSVPGRGAAIPAN